VVASTAAPSKALAGRECPAARPEGDHERHQRHHQERQADHELLEQPPHPLVTLPRGEPGQGRQQHPAQGNHEHAHHRHDGPARVGQGGDEAGSQQGGEHPIHHEVQLDEPARQQTRGDRAAQLAQGGIAEAHARPGQAARLGKAGHEEAAEDGAGQGSPGEGQDPIAIREQEQGQRTGGGAHDHSRRRQTVSPFDEVQVRQERRRVGERDDRSHHLDEPRHLGGRRVVERRCQERREPRSDPGEQEGHAAGPQDPDAKEPAAIRQAPPPSVPARCI
jgi:hypothetical protein